MAHHAPIVVTSGEPAGVGPELCAALAASPYASRLIILGDSELLQSRGALAGTAVNWREAHNAATDRLPAHTLRYRHIPLATAAQPGKLNAKNGRYVLNLLDHAIAGCMSGEFAAMVTAPLQKSTIIESGEPRFIGHTEYLQQKTGTPHVVMMLVGGGLRVALATIHIPLADVPRSITTQSLIHTLTVLVTDLKTKFGIQSPRVLVAGLNPHAGESGHLGREDIDIIAPAVAALQARGADVRGPLPADTLFTPRQLEGADAVLAMYHDQGLPVLKYASFGHGVNVTLGLPIVRTSVDHGTALDLAGTRRADPGSMLAAVKLACELVDRTKA